MALGNKHAFFNLPTELHTHIFVLACTPSPILGCTAASHYIAFFTGRALSLVSKYFNVTSIPARHRTIILYGWREIHAFSRILSRSAGACIHVRTCHLTLIADDLPQDPASFLTGKCTSLLPSPRVSDKAVLELLLLNVIADILTIVSHDLYELEIGFQVIEHVRDPLGYLSLAGRSPLFFPYLETLFFISSPSSASLPSIPASSTAISSMLRHISCPRLKELTLVCNDPPLNSIESPLQGQILDLAGELVDEQMQVYELDDIDNIMPMQGLISERTHNNTFPSLIRLTILASSPARALAALNADEVTWDVGCSFKLRINGSDRQSASQIPGLDRIQDLDKSKEVKKYVWLPQNFQTVVLRPRTCWDENWESLRDVANRQRETNMEPHKTSGQEDRTSYMNFNVFVLRPGEQLG